VALAVWGGAACRIRSTGPDWIEVHGHAVARRLAGGPTGVWALCSSDHACSYPSGSGTWVDHPEVTGARAIAASRAGLHFIDAEGRLGRLGGGRVEGALAALGPNTSALATDEEGRTVYAIIEGHVYQVQDGSPVRGPCYDLTATGLAVVGGELWVADGQGLFVAAGGACRAVGGPRGAVRVAGFGDQVLAVDAAGDVFRRRDGDRWERLPRPLRFRPDTMPERQAVRELAVSATAAWVTDGDGVVYVLSEAG
jgi:hypothetical protein